MVHESKMGRGEGAGILGARFGFTHYTNTPFRSRDLRLMYETKLERNRGATVTAIFSNAEVQRASSATATAKPSDPQQQQPPTVMRSVFTVLIPASRVWGVGDWCIR